MRWTGCAVLLLLVLSCTLCLASTNPAVGKWACISDDGHGTVIHWTLTISETRGKLSGSLVDENLESIPLLDTTANGNALTFKTFINSNCTAAFNLNIDGNKLKGTFACPEVEGTLEGTRELRPMAK